MRVFTAVLMILTFGYAQGIDDLIRGPILGYTFGPEVGKIDLSMSYVTLSANSSFNDDGKEISYNDDFDGLAEPEISQSAIQFSSDYAISNVLGISISVPFITGQSVDWNPASGYEGYFQNASGETGLGDLTISAWYQLLKDTKGSMQVAAGYQLATGSSPEDVGENSFSSTGSGHTSIKAGFAADFIATSSVLFSASSIFAFNQEAAFSSGGYSWDEKEGNEIVFSGRASLLASPVLSVGLDFDYFFQGEGEFDGETIDGSSSNFMSITPMLGYRLISGSTSLSLNGGYILNIAGKNYPKLSGMVFGATAFFKN